MSSHHVPDELYAEIVAHFPLVCVEVVLENDGSVLVAKRINAPARGEWFWPGGRLYKDEELADAARRIGRGELGIDIELEEELGVQAHFWETSDVAGNPSRHTVNVVFRATPASDRPEIVLDDQHSAFRFLDAPEPGLHEYVVRYMEEFDLPG